MKLNRVLATGFVGVCLAIGGIAPAASEGNFSVYGASFNSYFHPESDPWVDRNLDAANGWVQYNNCVRDNDLNFDIDFAVYKEDWGPDTKVGQEWIQCARGSSQTSDRVYFGDVGADEYHFTYKGLRDHDPGRGDGVTITKYTVNY